jgi:hypothetical protein
VKTGKTAVVGAIAASAMPYVEDADLLGFKSSNPQGLALLWFDSEQSPDDFWHCVSRAVKRAGLKQLPPWLHAYCLTGLDHIRAWKCVNKVIHRAADINGGIHSILLDGAADLVADVNDAKESNAFVATLHGIAIERACPIIGVIHFNPGSEKTRGHLGSQLERKSETNLCLEKADGVTTIWSEKQRRAPIPKNDGPCFEWCNKAGMHVTAETRREKVDGQKKETLSMLADDIFSNGKPMRYYEIVAKVKKLSAVSESTAARKVRELSRFGLIVKSAAGLWTPSKKAENP